ncbi:MAG: agmatinase family protein [Phycisphaerales bacterium]
MARPFDPNSVAPPGAGIFGLPDSRDDAHIVIHGVPFDATQSYGVGAANAPEAIRQASLQVDLFDRQFGRIYEQGICLLPVSKELARLSKSTRKLAAPLIRKAGADPRDNKPVKQINAACEKVAEITYTTAWSILAQGKVPGLIGGDHSTSMGQIRACAEYVQRLQGGMRVSPRDAGLGILQLDAHMDLRPSFQGFKYSHASIMHNVLAEVPAVTKLVQVGVRDFGEIEFDAARSHRGRVTTHFDQDWAEALADGANLSRLIGEALKPLPSSVYVTFDIDALEPSHCPSTGTPVPGGLSFAQAAMLLMALRDSGRTVVGFDLVEVCPCGRSPDWDAAVGARVLYKLCGAAAARQ